ncbi:MAG: creatininase family protein, partial [Variovorax sp.]
MRPVLLGGAQRQHRDRGRRVERGEVTCAQLGATEQHGPHLPLGVDTLLADGILTAALP